MGIVGFLCTYMHKLVADRFLIKNVSICHQMQERKMHICICACNKGGFAFHCRHNI